MYSSQEDSYPNTGTGQAEGPCPWQKTLNGLSFHLVQSCEESVLNLLADVIRHPGKYADSTEASHLKDSLSGRGLIKFVEAPGLGSVAVKQYRRGGLISRVVRERYLMLNHLRPEKEVAILQQAKKLGVNVPSPLGFVTEGGLFYKAWLLTEEIPEHQSLSEIAHRDLSLLSPLISELVAQVSLLIAARIHHIDLHPGNTVVSGDNEVYILDFDKADRVNMDAKDLRDAYLVRWRRAVIKHNLPEMLSETFCLELRRSAILEK